MEEKYGPETAYTEVMAFFYNFYLHALKMNAADGKIEKNIKNTKEDALCMII